MSRFNQEMNGHKLRITLFAAFLCVLSLTHAGCGSSGVTTSGNSASSANGSNTVASNGQPTGPTEVSADQVNDPSVAANGNVMTSQQQLKQRLEQMRAEAANKPVDPNAGKITRPGPENSVITSQLADVARETRVFNNHPSLVSVEKIQGGGTNKVIITLKDGRKVELAGDSVMNITTVTTAQLMSLAGSQSAEKRDLNSKTKN